jgi:hypothetical protein
MMASVGRPPKPSITQTPAGTWLVRATINGEQKRQVMKTRESAQALLESWAGANPLPLLPTRLSAANLRRAEAAHELLSTLGFDLLGAARWIVQHYQPDSGRVTWADAWKEYERFRGNRASAQRIANVRQAWESFAAHTERKLIGNPSREEVESWLANSLPTECAPATYNHRCNDLSTTLAWLAKRGVISANPCTQVDRQKVTRGSPSVLSPTQCESALRYAEQHAPDWVSWLAVMLFAGVRPGLRESGECRRLSDDLSSGRSVILPGGLLVRGKAHGERVVP